MPIALRFNAVPWHGSGWRAVEAQHKNATMALVHGRLDDQAVLEDIIEAVKPRRPPETDGLDFLLWTPFRYQSPPPAGSRFRGRQDPGVFYGAEDITTACAEAGYWRFRFLVDSEGLAAQPCTMPMTVFEFHGATESLLDLTRPPLVSRRDEWIRPHDYAATQVLANDCRNSSIEVIRSESVRNSPEGRCLTILTPAVFRAAKAGHPMRTQSWSLYIDPAGTAAWQSELSGDEFEMRYSGTR